MLLRYAEMASPISRQLTKSAALCHSLFGLFYMEGNTVPIMLLTLNVKTSAAE